jgi:glycine/D-amino acid oxidase-like deaminating enzyme
MVEEPSTGAQAVDPQPKAAPAAATDSGYGGTWFTATGESAPVRASLTQDIDVDVCIVGGGLAGLTTALEVARRGWSVAVLEARRVAWNASSRNTGFVRPGFDQRPETLVERVGTDHARELWLLSQDGADYMRRTANELGGRDLVQGEGWLQISKIDRAGEMSDAAERLRSLGADVELWPAKLVREKIKSPHYFQAIHFPTAFNIHPYNYALGLARLAEQAGARLFEGTPALSIDPAGVRKRVITAQGRVRASHIVFAGNIHLGAMLPDAADTLIPLHTFAMVTKPLGDTLTTALEYPGAVSDSESSGHHYRIVGGDRLMFAGRLATRPSNPDRHARWLRADLRRRFPQLGQVDIDHAWGGAIGVTVHRMPQIGEVAPGVWLASGFGGHGLNTSAMAATLITGAIVDGDDRFRLFEPFELIWSGGRMGGVVAKYFYAAHRRYEEWASRRSRSHEVWLVKNEPRLKKEAEEAAERARIRAEEAAVAEAARIEREKLEAEQAEIRRIERERIAAEKAEARRIRAEEKAAAKAEAARLKEEQREAARAEKERIADEKAEAKRVEAERLAAERAEAERIETERRAAEQADAEQLEAAYRNAERVAENAARLIAEGSSVRSVPADGGSPISAAPDVSPSTAGASEPEKPLVDKSDEPGAQRRRGFWRRN